MHSFVRSVTHWGSQSSAIKAQIEQNNLCEVCHQKPKYVEGGFQHPFCSRTCARSLQSSTPVPVLNPCGLHGCRAPIKQGFSYCSEVHARDAVRLGQTKACTHCKVHPVAVGELCVACDHRMRAAPRLRELNPSDVVFKSVQSHFEGNWESAGKVPKIERVIEVIGPQDVQASYQAYRMQVGSPPEIRTYHSSQCVCDLGVRAVNLCFIRSCGICSIVRSSFSAFAFGAPHNNGRLGAGIYSYENPALADRFSTSCLSSPYRVMIACDVIIASMSGSSLPSPVTPKPGGKPIFVEDPEAIMPTYLILYAR